MVAIAASSASAAPAACNDQTDHPHRWDALFVKLDGGWC
jgi:hypothetical protein